MKLNKIILQAFGPFAHREVVDFEKLSSSSIFLISGPTGSGKTTIFDAICFALYGKVSGKRKDAKTLKSSFSPPDLPAFVTLEFTCNRSLYCITRYPRQEKLNYQGKKTVLEPKAELILPNGKRITRMKLIAEEIEKILGLKEDDFEKLVMLPQGNFQKLLLEKGKDRVETLRHIFRTQLFARITELFYHKAKDFEEAQKKWENQCRQIFEDIEDLSLDNLSIQEGMQTLHQHNKNCQIKQQRLLENLSVLEAKREKFQKKILQCKKIEENVRLLEEKETVFEGLQKRKEEMDALKKELELVQSLQPLFSVYDQCGQIKRKLKKLEIDLQEAEACYASCEKEQRRCEEEGKQAAELELQTQHLQKELVLLEEMATRAQKREDLQRRLQEVETQIAMLSKQKQRQETAQEISALKLQILKRQKWKSLSKSILDTEQKLNAAQKNYLEKSHLYLKTQAAFLAERLEEGKPCPVCGSTRHPKKTTNSSHVRREEVEKCLQTRDHLAQELQNLRLQQNGLSDEVEKTAPLEILQEKLAKAETDLSKYTSLQTDSIAREDLLSQWEKTLLEKEKLHAAIKEYPKEAGSMEEYHAKKEEREAKLRENMQWMKKIQQAHLDLQHKIGALTERKTSLQTQRKTMQLQLKELQIHLHGSLKEKGLSESKLEEYQDKKRHLEKNRKRLEEYQSKVKEISAVIRLLKDQLQGVRLPDIPSLTKQYDDCTEKYNQCKQTYSHLRDKLAVQLLCEKNLDKIKVQMEKASAQYGVLQKLSRVARGSQNGMSFEKYVLSSYFDEVIAYANLRAEKMNGFHYQLIRMQDDYQDGISLGVWDTYNGDIRPINTLSGGETFVASLSLSLGLADVISKNAGGVLLETMLIDEGFGSLDDQYLKSVTDCLNQLQESHRQIGVISHIRQLKEQIPNRISVEKCGPFEGSRIRVYGEGDWESTHRLAASGFFPQEVNQEKRKNGK